MLEWISDDFSDKFGMLVPISLNEKRYWYQLDTGADEVVPYGSPKEGPFGFPMFPWQGCASPRFWGTRGRALRIGRTPTILTVLLV